MAVIAKQRYKLDIAPRGGWVIVYVSQHDDGAREIEFEITNQGKAFSIPASINVSVQGVKSNKSYFSHSCSYSGNVVTMALADDMTDVIGKAICVLKFTNSSQQKLATAKFILNVDSDSSSEGVIIDTEAEEIFNQMLNEIRAQAASISADIAELQSMVGSPLVASTASAMTDHNKIYVYTGSESGYINGNWYYWNGSTWTSGGVYNAVAIDVDEFPTQGSPNTVSSGGVYSLLAVVASEATAQELLEEETRYTELLDIILNKIPSEETAQRFFAEETKATELVKLILSTCGKQLDIVVNGLKNNNDWLEIINREVVEQHENGLKLAVIGDSLSAPITDVIKYHDLIVAKNNYEVTNLSVGSTGYLSYGSKGGSRNNRFFEQANSIPDDTDAVLVFGSFNDCNMLEGRAILIRPDESVSGQSDISENPSSTATELSVDEITDYRFIHNVTVDRYAGTYKMICGDKTYEFTTTIVVRAGGKIQIRFPEIGDIDSIGEDTLAGAFEEMLNNIYAKNNSMLVGIVSPTPWKSYNLFEPQNETRKQRAIDYNNLLKQLAELHSLPYLDLFHGSNLRPWDADFRQKYYLSADGIHPNALGHAKYLYPQIREFLRTFNPMII